MKIQINKNGWTEITTKNIIINSINKDPFILNKDWLNYNKKFGDKKRKRQSCKCCKRKWEETKSDIYLIMTNIGNLSICINCVRAFSHLIKINNV